VTAVVVGESILVDEPTTDFEGMRLALLAAEERGHPAPSVVVAEDGRPLTHPDYVDRMGVAHQRAGLWAFCRRPAAEAFGLPSGTDWVRDHCMHLMFEEALPYRAEPHLYHQLYLQRFGSPDPVTLAPVSAAEPPAFSVDGSRVCVLEERPGLGWPTTCATALLWEYELALGTRRLITAFAYDEHISAADVTYSGDGTYVHICSWMTGRNVLVRVADGLVVPLPFTTAAAAWSYRDGPNAMVVMSTTASGSLLAHDYDVGTGEFARRCEVASPNGAQLLVRQLAMSLDGRALVTAPVGAAGFEQLRRGGVHVAAFVDLDEATIEPVLPASFRTRGAQRRHTSPRWCEDLGGFRPSSTAPSDKLIEQGYRPAIDPETVGPMERTVDSWVEALSAIEVGWRNGVIPRSRFAQEFAQFAISCNEVDTSAADDVLRRFKEHVAVEPVARVVRGWMGETHRLWEPLPAELRERASGQPKPADPNELRALDSALASVVGAGDATQMRESAHGLLGVLAARGVAPAETWPVLASWSADLMRQREFPPVVKIALAAFLWNNVQAPFQGQSELGPTAADIALPLMLDGFEASTHLSERVVIGQDRHQLFDVETARNLLRRALSRLPLEEHLITRARPSRMLVDPVAMPDPARIPFRKRGPSAMGRKVVFVSYLREDWPRVEPIVVRLRAADVEVWVDTASIEPGKNWKREIKRAIRLGDYFVACFSQGYADRDRSFMNEELRLAVAEQRLMANDRTWFIPVLLEPCAVPDFEIDWSTSLETLQYVDFAVDWEDAMARLIRAVSR
jgi:hypothetical protein